MSTNSVSLTFGAVSKKTIITPNHFVSHMLEHIAWRTGISPEISWHDEQWQALGSAVGKAIAAFPSYQTDSAALGMIDDGSAVVAVSLGQPSVTMHAKGGVDLPWFLGLRCEQITSGSPLIELLEGLSEGLQAAIDVTVWTLEDTHHTWEGIYRALGIALGRMYTPRDTTAETETRMAQDTAVEQLESSGDLRVLERGVNYAVVQRRTAETGITVKLHLGQGQDTRKGAVVLAVDPSIEHAVAGVEEVLQLFADALGASVELDFRAIMLSSSHVVLEDTAMVLGRALLEIIKLRMEKYGIHGAGSSIVDSKKNANVVQVGVSVEGRKFWRLVPEDGDYARLRKQFVIGQTLENGLRSEDLDDFVDGLAGGLSASLMIHIKTAATPAQGWQEIFTLLGVALRQALSANPYRRGVAPGVKATLA